MHLWLLQCDHVCLSFAKVIIIMPIIQVHRQRLGLMVNELYREYRSVSKLSLYDICVKALFPAVTGAQSQNFYFF